MAAIKDEKAALAVDGSAYAKANANQASAGLRPNNEKQGCVNIHLWKLVGGGRFKCINSKHIFSPSEFIPAMVKKTQFHLPLAASWICTVHFSDERQTATSE